MNRVTKMGEYGRNAHRLFTTNSFAGLETGQNLLAAFLAGGIEQLPPGMRSSPRLMRDFLRSAAAQTDAPYSKLPLVVGVDDEGMVEFEMTDQDVIQFLQELEPDELAELQRRNPTLFARGPSSLPPPPPPPPLPDPCEYFIARAWQNNPQNNITIRGTQYGPIVQSQNPTVFNTFEIYKMLMLECNTWLDPCDYMRVIADERGVATVRNIQFKILNGDQFDPLVVKQMLARCGIVIPADVVREPPEPQPLRNVDYFDIYVPTLEAMGRFKDIMHCGAAIREDPNVKEYFAELEAFNAAKQADPNTEFPRKQNEVYDKDHTTRLLTWLDDELAEYNNSLTRCRMALGSLSVLLATQEELDRLLGPGIQISAQTNFQLRRGNVPVIINDINLYNAFYKDKPACVFDILVYFPEFVAKYKNLLQSYYDAKQGMDALQELQLVQDDVCAEFERDFNAIFQGNLPPNALNAYKEAIIAQRARELLQNDDVIRQLSPDSFQAFLALLKRQVVSDQFDVGLFIASVQEAAARAEANYQKLYAEFGLMYQESARMSAALDIANRQDQRIRELFGFGDRDLFAALSEYKTQCEQRKRGPEDQGGREGPKITVTDDAAAEIATLKTALSTRDALIDGYLRQIQELQQQSRDVPSVLAAGANAQVETLTNQVARLQTRLTEVQASDATEKLAAARLQQRVDELQRELVLCQTRGTALEARAAAGENMATELAAEKETEARLRAELAACQQQHTTDEERIVALERSSAEKVDRLKTQLTDANNELAAERAELERKQTECNERIKALTTQIQALSELVDKELQDDAELETTRSELKRTREKLKEEQEFVDVLAERAAELELQNEKRFKEAPAPPPSRPFSPPSEPPPVYTLEQLNSFDRNQLEVLVFDLTKNVPVAATDDDLKNIILAAQNAATIQQGVTGRREAVAGSESISDIESVMTLNEEGASKTYTRDELNVMTDAELDRILQIISNETGVQTFASSRNAKIGAILNIQRGIAEKRG